MKEQGARANGWTYFPAVKDWFRRTAYAVGALTLYHRIRNRRNLTVVMFHRILPPMSSEWHAADHDYTLTTDLFAECLAFFDKHYNVISLNQLVEASTTKSQLPPRPLLITFDDGWSDTYRYAAPLLQENKLPAICFVVADALDDANDRWWHDTYTRVWRRDRAVPEKVATALASVPAIPQVHISSSAHNDYLLTLARLHQLPASTRDAVLAGWWGNDQPRAVRQMLTVDQTRCLRSAGVAIGGHGATHLPLTLCALPREELMRTHARLERVMAGTEQTEVIAMSFPHGRFTNETVKAAEESGFRLIFTSIPTLTALGRATQTFGLHGRIEIATQLITDSEGRFRPDWLALNLFFRPAVALPTAPAT